MRDVDINESVHTFKKWHSASSQDEETGTKISLSPETIKKQKIYKLFLKHWATKNSDLWDTGNKHDGFTNCTRLRCVESFMLHIKEGEPEGAQWLLWAEEIELESWEAKGVVERREP